MDQFNVQEPETELLALPLSSTGQQGFVSTKALDVLSAAREQGVKVVLISGARTSTILERLPYLPQADAVVTENGGRIWYTDGHWKTCLPMREDLEWRQSLAQLTGTLPPIISVFLPPFQRRVVDMGCACHTQAAKDAMRGTRSVATQRLPPPPASIASTAAGPLENDASPASERSGPLWDQFRKFEAANLHLDARSYATAFRVADKANTGALPDLIAGLPEGAQLLKHCAMSPDAQPCRATFAFFAAGIWIDSSPRVPGPPGVMSRDAPATLLSVSRLPARDGRAAVKWLVRL